MMCLFLQVTATFDMIGYPKWIEDLEKLDKYYENVSIFMEVCDTKLVNFGKTCYKGEV